MNQEARNSIRLALSEARSQVLCGFIEKLINILDDEGFDLIFFLEGVCTYLEKFDKLEKFQRAAVYLQKAIDALNEVP